MAGSPQKQKEYNRLQDKIAEQATEIDRLRGIIASHCPEALAGDLPEAVTEYDSSICERVRAYGRNGMDESEWIAQLGLSADKWDEWVRMYPELMEATQTAHASMCAYWSGEQRRAIQENNTRFPVNIARDKISSSLRSSGKSKGDASKLVLLDLRLERCPACLEPLPQ